MLASVIWLQRAIWRWVRPSNLAASAFFHCSIYHKNHKSTLEKKYIIFSERSLIPASVIAWQWCIEIRFTFVNRPAIDNNAHFLFKNSIDFEASDFSRNIERESFPLSVIDVAVRLRQTKFGQLFVKWSIPYPIFTLRVISYKLYGTTLYSMAHITYGTI